MKYRRGHYGSGAVKLQWGGQSKGVILSDTEETLAEPEDPHPQNFRSKELKKNNKSKN